MDNFSSVDTKEVEKFRALAEQWWDKNGKFKILHEINPLRLQYIIDKITQHFKLDLQGLDTSKQLSSKSIIDIGCGGGLLTIPLAKIGANIKGIDAVVENINTAQQAAEMQCGNEHELAINFECTTIEEVAKKKEKFDVALCIEVMEHVANPSNFIAQIASVLKPDGMLIVSTINRNIKSYLQAVIAAEYILGWVPPKTHDYNKFIKPSELNSMLASSHMKLKELKGFTFNITTQSWQLNDDIDVNNFFFLSCSD